MTGTPLDTLSTEGRILHVAPPTSPLCGPYDRYTTGHTTEGGGGEELSFSLSVVPMTGTPVATLLRGGGGEELSFSLSVAPMTGTPLDTLSTEGRILHVAPPTSPFCGPYARYTSGHTTEGDGG